MSLLAREDHETVSWSLKEFSIGKDFKWSKPEEEDDGTELFVDRATHEFGIVYYDSLNSSRRTISRHPGAGLLRSKDCPRSLQA
jgi:hypothetical protein